MGLWTRLKRSMRALFGGIVERTEDPELILQQTIRDMRDRIPDLNNSVAQVMATEKLLAKNKERLEQQVVDLDSKIKASVKMGRDDIATAYIGQLSQAQVDLQKTGHQYEQDGKQYFPQAQLLCGEDLWRPLATRFLLKWPSLQAVQKAKPATLKTSYYINGSRSAKLLEQRLTLMSWL